MRVIGYRHQRTLAAHIAIDGVGLITGNRVRICLHPAAVNTGVEFNRLDNAAGTNIPARTPFVTGTQRRTTLGPPGQGVTLVEHLLATLAALRIDNCHIDIDGPEPPGLDGSACGYVKEVVAVGAVEQPARQLIWSVAAPVTVASSGATITLHPAYESTELRISYLLNYGAFAPIPRQSCTLIVRPDEFVREVASCRTFVTQSEAEALRAQGIGKHLRPSDLLVFGPQGLIDNKLRFADEPARHKILDVIGDLALCGFDLAGHLVAYRSGHSLNVELARRLTAQAEAASRQAASFKFPSRSAIARAA